MCTDCHCGRSRNGARARNVNFAAEIIGIDVVDYVVDYQLVVAFAALLVVAILHIIIQKHFDLKIGHIASEHRHLGESELNTEQSDNKEEAPAIYAILPVIPLVLIFTFSKLVITTIKMDVTTAMFVSLVVTLIFEFFRRHSAMAVVDSIQHFFLMVWADNLQRGHVYRCRSNICPRLKSDWRD